MPQDTGGILNLKKPVGSDDIRLQTIGIDLPYNFQKIDDAFTAHQAESAQKHITESGENANGRYIRFDDGTQICIIQTRVTTDSTMNQVEFDVVFPAPFTNTDYAVSHAWYGGVPGRSGAFTKHAGARATGSITGVTYTSLSTNFTSATRTVATLVIGRWK